MKFSKCRKNCTLYLGMCIEHRIFAQNLKLCAMVKVPFFYLLVKRFRFTAGAVNVLVGGKKRMHRYHELPTLSFSVWGSRVLRLNTLSSPHFY